MRKSKAALRRLSSRLSWEHFRTRISRFASKTLQPDILFVQISIRFLHVFLATAS